METIVNPLSTPSLAVSSLTLVGIAIIVWSSYGVGANVTNRGSERYFNASIYASCGVACLVAAIGIIKFVE